MYLKWYHQSCFFLFEYKEFFWSSNFSFKLQLQGRSSRAQYLVVQSLIFHGMIGKCGKCVGYTSTSIFNNFNLSYNFKHQLQTWTSTCHVKLQNAASNINFLLQSRASNFRFRHQPTWILYTLKNYLENHRINL